MDSRYLRAFVAVADQGGISAAAQALGYAQSSLSAQLKRLEANLGVAVLVRAGTGAVLTEAGERLLPHAREALELEERMRRAARGDRPRLRIGAQESLAHVWMPDVLAALEYGAAGSRAGADVELTVANRSTLEQSFGAGELDLVFQYDNGVRALGPHAVVGHDRTLLVAAPSHPLARQELVTPEQMLAYDFLVAEPGCTSEMLVDRFGRDLLAGAQLALVQGSLSALLRLTGHGHGVSLLPELAVTRELGEGELVELRLAERIRPVSIVAQWRPRPGPAEEALRALLELARRADPLPEVTRTARSARAS
ncbi:LysR family transcriptional regulator [Streptomyces canus]|uniref:DNA-binding transcriptional LysR family regulator n=1 Tax=Streptomyces canus TaxID=58343 RepID=A0AAW8FV08_9ACTN|nr:LysR family transcriptional regulator [Streptomyces canus]MDQ0757898.1 DNA-binding transcriptional LysR family regulator [Streptomyces canus]MDQ0913355.1 DNA-binding transcriptional LysR family regulator [Streptomyces canus]MDQ1073393.1 DNA-binding transcriptional LysR family regulator [Streptomyces canus]